MRTLYRGLKGDDVRAWEYFLLGQDPKCHIIADGYFDDVTHSATKAFQAASGFAARACDGIVGPSTLSRAFLLGFNPLMDGRLDENSPNWPPAPDGSAPLSPARRELLFGNFSYVPAPTPGNPEGIKITDGWNVKNIIQIEIPQLAHLKIKKVSCHKLIAPQLKSMFVAWSDSGLADKILTWNGSWVPRFIRGSRSTLSNHSWGTAFDMNVAWNGLGVQPALKGSKGSVRELAMIAYDYGFYWGGWFKKRPDGMHFEAYKIIT